MLLPVPSDFIIHFISMVGHRDVLMKTPLEEQSKQSQFWDQSRLY